MPKKSKPNDVNANRDVIMGNQINYNANLGEPPDAAPHVRWCERRRLAAASYSIICSPYAVSFCLHRAQARVSGAKNLYDCLRDPSLSLRESRLGA